MTSEGKLSGEDRARIRIVAYHQQSGQFRPDSSFSARAAQPHFSQKELFTPWAAVMQAKAQQNPPRQIEAARVIKAANKTIDRIKWKAERRSALSLLASSPGWEQEEAENHLQRHSWVFTPLWPVTCGWQGGDLAQGTPPCVALCSLHNNEHCFDRSHCAISHYLLQLWLPVNFDWYWTPLLLL